MPALMVKVFAVGDVVTKVRSPRVMSPPVEAATPAVVSKVTSVITWVAPSKAMAPPSVMISAETTEAPLTPKPAPPLAAQAT